MIVILRPGAQKARVEALMSQIKQQGVDIHYSQGATETILGLVGDTTHVDEDWLRASDIVEDVRRVSEPYSFAGTKNLLCSMPCFRIELVSCVPPLIYLPRDDGGDNRRERLRQRVVVNLRRFSGFGILRGGGKYVRLRHASPPSTSTSARADLRRPDGHSAPEM